MLGFRGQTGEITGFDPARCNRSAPGFIFTAAAATATGRGDDNDDGDGGDHGRRGRAVEFARAAVPATGGRAVMMMTARW